METKFLLTGPQGIGKTRAAKRLAAALGLSHIVDDWNGSDDLPGNTLGINNDGLPRIDGWDEVVVIQVASREGLQAFIRALGADKDERLPNIPQPQPDSAASTLRTLVMGGTTNESAFSS